MNRSRPFPRIDLVLAFTTAALVACQPAGDDSSASPGTGGKSASDAGSGRGGSGAAGGSGGRPGSGGTGGTTPAPGTGGGSGGSGGSGGAAGEGGSAGSGAVDPNPVVDAAPMDSPPGSPGGPPQSGVPAPSPACTAGAVMPGPTGRQQIQATGKNRSFIIRLPGGYDGKRPFPVLLSFHGAGGNGASFETGAFGAVSRMAADRAIRIYPDGLGNGWSRDEPDDVLFMDALVKWLETRICYDTARVYAAGQSSGAYFSHRLACDRGSLIRAIATNSGGQRRERALADCKAPVAAWISAGSADNPGHVMGAIQARDMWATRNGCGMGAMPVPPSPCMARVGCQAGYPVVHCQHGGGHAIPGYGAAGIVGFLFDSKF